MNLLIISYFNSSNYGDCYLSNALFEHYSKQYKCSKLSYTMNPFEFMDVSNLKSIRIDKTSNKKDKILNIVNAMKLNNIIYLYYNKKKIFSADVDMKVKRAIQKSDMVIIGGGNMVFDLTEKTLTSARLKHFIDICHKIGKKVFICSIGIGPFANNKQYIECIKTLESVEAVSFRDPMAFELYKKYAHTKNGYLSTDVAFWEHKNVDYQMWQTRKKVIGINIIDPSLFSEKREIEVKKNYVRLIKKIVQENPESKVIIFTTELRDNDFANKVFKESESDNVELECLQNENQLMNTYRKLKVIISSRMHSAIIAFNHGIPAIGLAWQDKMYGLFYSLKMNNAIFDFFHFDIEQVSKRVSSYLELDNYCYDNILNEVTEYIGEKLECNDRIVESLLK